MRGSFTWYTPGGETDWNPQLKDWATDHKGTIWLIFGRRFRIRLPFPALFHSSFNLNTPNPVNLGLWWHLKCFTSAILDKKCEKKPYRVVWLQQSRWMHFYRRGDCFTLALKCIKCDSNDIGFLIFSGIFWCAIHAICCVYYATPHNSTLGYLQCCSLGTGLWVSSVISSLRQRW